MIAGELSGDRLGAGLVRAVRARRPDSCFAGIAGPAMQSAGCTAWRESRELAVMGLFEVLRHLPRLRRVIVEATDQIVRERPAVLVGIDAPDFNLRVEKSVRRAGIPTVHYVSPSVWAWRAGRVRTLREACDLVLCLLPFEQAFLAAHGVPAEFVGHPLADELPANPPAEPARRALALAADAPTVAVLPGSRRGELERLGPVFARTIAWLRARAPALQFVAPMATSELAAGFRAQLAALAPGVPVTLVDCRSHEAMIASDVVLLASGTATLEAMLLGRPMVVAYRLSPLTYGMLRGLRLVRVPHVSLPNLLAGEGLVPELLQSAARPDRLGAAVLSLLESGARRGALLERFAELHEQLRKNASARAAEAVLRVAEAR